jgi:hypothetical protein
MKLEIFIGLKSLFNPHTNLIMNLNCQKKYSLEKICLIDIFFKKSNTMRFDTNKYNINRLYSLLIYKNNTDTYLPLIIINKHIFLFTLNEFFVSISIQI